MFKNLKTIFLEKCDQKIDLSIFLIIFDQKLTKMRKNMKTVLDEKCDQKID